MTDWLHELQFTLALTSIKLEKKSHTDILISFFTIKAYEFFLALQRLQTAVTDIKRTFHNEIHFKRVLYNFSQTGKEIFKSSTVKAK